MRRKGPKPPPNGKGNEKQVADQNSPKNGASKPEGKKRTLSLVLVFVVVLVAGVLAACVFSGADQGGHASVKWTPVPAYHRFSDAGCGIRRLTVHESQSPADVERLMRHDEPVIMPLASSWPRAAADWAKHRLYEFARSADGGGTVKVGDRKQIVSEQGYADAAGTTLFEYLEMISAESPPEIALFDQSTFCERYGNLCRSHGIPQSWQQALSVGENSSVRTFVSIGPDNSGAGAHDHSDTVFALLHGEKWFLCLPPLAIPTAELQARYPGCLLRPGEMIFIPEGWSHATANVGDAVGVSLQSYNYRSLAHQLRSRISTARHAGSLRDYVASLEEAVTSVPDVWEFKIDLAKVMAEEPQLHQTPEQRSRISQLFKDGSSLEPNSCEALLSAARFHMAEDSRESRSKKRAMSYGAKAYQKCSGAAALDACVEHATAQAWAGKWGVARTALQRALQLSEVHADHPRIPQQRILGMLQEVSANLAKS